MSQTPGTNTAVKQEPRGSTHCSAHPRSPSLSPQHLQDPDFFSTRGAGPAITQIMLEAASRYADELDLTRNHSQFLLQRSHLPPHSLKEVRG